LLLDFGSRTPLRILCAREIQNTIADSVHQLLSDQIRALGLESFYTVKEKEIVGRNGTAFAFTGLRAQSIANLKSYEGFDICWVEEAQVVSRKSWDVLTPTIRKEGSEIWLTFNPELDTDETYERFIVSPPERSIVVKLTYRDNPWLPPELDEERREFLRRVDLGLRSRDDYQNIWEGECRPTLEGAIYAKEIEKCIEQKRIGNVPYDPLLKVHTVWDLGWNVMAVGMYQRQASELRVIDYEEFNAMTYNEVIGELEKRKYRWGKDWLPHDSKSHNPLNKRSPKELLTALGRDVEEVPEIGVEPGIESARQLFAQCYFDRERTKVLINRLKRYCRREDKATGMFKGPMDDENSHGADQFRYASVIVSQMTNDNRSSLKLSDVVAEGMVA
jgi:phage terminase large subunit